MITITQTGIDGLALIDPVVFGDARGYFMETWNLSDFTSVGLCMDFVQDNQSRSRKGVLRGLHFQKTAPQGKLVRVIEGEVFDVAVDIRAGSTTFGRWFGVLLSEENKKQLYIPEGFAHGFLVTSEYATFVYKCTRFYNPADEGGILWSDPEIGIVWPEFGDSPQLSDKDRQYGSLSSVAPITLPPPAAIATNRRSTRQ